MWVIFFLSVKDMAKDRLPTLPRYISRATITREKVFKLLVRPAVIPTVLMAEKVSNRASTPFKFWAQQIAIPAVTAREILIKNTEEAFWMAASSSLLPKIFAPWVLVSVDFKYTKSTTMVVTLIPPAVEPGAPPINIKTMVKSLLPSVIAPVSTELNPAVLGVTEQNREFKICSIGVISEKSLFFSMK